MVAKTYKVIQVVGVSDQSIQQGVRNALAKAAETIRNIDWFEVDEIRGLVDRQGQPTFQVSVKIGFRLEDQPAN